MMMMNNTMNILNSPYLTAHVPL